MEKDKVIGISGQKIKIIKKLMNQDGKAFVYLDPPYYPITKRVNKLYNGDFLPVDFLKLKERCDDLTKEGIPFVLSNSDCEFIRVLFREYVIVEIYEPRGMKKGKQRPKEKCLIITNFKQKKDLMESVERLDKLIEEKR